LTARPSGIGWRLCAAVLLALVPPDATAQSGDTVDLTVRIVDSRSGRPLPDVVLELSGLGGRFVTDEDGGARFSAPIGTYLLVARKAGYLLLDGDFEVRRPGSITLRMDRSTRGEAGAPGRLQGTVREAGTERPIEGAEVSAAELGSAITDDQGRFFFESAAPGLAEIQVRMLGYAERAEPVTVLSGRTTHVRMTLAVDPIELDPIEVEVRSRFLERRGVYRRMERGVATRLVTRDHIEARMSQRLSDSLDDIAGLNLVRVDKRAILLGRSRCQLRIYVDGVRMQADIEGSVDIDQIPPDWVEVAEVFSGIASVPAEYAEAGQDCGVVLIWTRQRAG
jgi:protocatechuate 3,4-dioxygenase beta subunit